jgi:hypothetical protein
LSAEYAAIAAELKRTWMLDYATTARPGDTAFLEANWEGQKSVPKSVTLPASLGPGSDDAKPSHLLPAVFYKSVLGTQVMAIVSFFIVLLAASLAHDDGEGRTPEEADRAHLAPDIKTKRKQERERLAAAAGLFNATESAFEGWKLWKRLDRLVERSDLPVRTVEVFYVMCGFALVGGLWPRCSRPSMLITLAAFGGGFMAPVGFVWFKANRRLNALREPAAGRPASRSPQRSRQATASRPACRRSSTRATRPRARSSTACSLRRAREAAGRGPRGHVRKARLEELRLRDHRPSRSSSRSAAASPGSSTWSPTRSASGSSSSAR